MSHKLEQMRRLIPGLWILSSDIISSSWTAVSLIAAEKIVMTKTGKVMMIKTGWTIAMMKSMRKRMARRKSKRDGLHLAMKPISIISCTAFIAPK